MIPRSIKGDAGGSRSSAGGLNLKSCQCFLPSIICALFRFEAFNATLALQNALRNNDLLLSTTQCCDRCDGHLAARIGGPGQQSFNCFLNGRKTREIALKFSHWKRFRDGNGYDRLMFLFDFFNERFSCARFIRRIRKLFFFIHVRFGSE